MTPAMAWTWFGIAWLFLAAVLLSRWYAREHRDAEATEEALKHTRQTTDDSHIWDVV